MGAVLVAALMALGCVVLWAGIPVGWLWLAAAISHSATTIYLIALVGAPITMIAWGFALARMNRVYLLLARGGEESKLLEVLVAASAVLALGAFLVWFFFFAGSPTATPWPDELSGPGT